jgi:hypothetical protein
MTDAEAALVLQAPPAIVSRVQWSRLRAVSIYALIFAGILLIGRYQIGFLVPRILAAARAQRLPAMAQLDDTMTAEAT